MSEVLIATLDAGGNLPPALALARLLGERGDHVRFLSSPAQHDAIHRAGHPVRTYSSAAPVDSRRTGGLPAIAWRQVAAFADRGAAADVIAEASRVPTDLVVIDCLMVAAVRDAVATGLPVVSLVHTMWSFFEATVRGPFGLLLRARGVDAGAALHAPAVKLVTAMPEFERGTAGDGVHRLGALEARDARAAVPVEERPVVLVSLSTTYLPGQAGAMQRILDALAPLPVDVVATTGPAIDPGSLRVPANARVERSLPHDEVLRRASLVVGHGGHGTTARALAHGVPVLVLPMNPLIDQPWIAQAVERTGVGRRLPGRASAARIRAAAEAILGDGPERASARALGERMRSNDPGAALDRALEAMGVPATPRSRPE
ncbi:hypothetical protein GCM10009840_20200 [Pseudolysinimonas kribbensis]